MLWLSFSLFSIGAEYTRILSVPTDKSLKIEVGRTWGLCIESCLRTCIDRNFSFVFWCGELALEFAQAFEIHRVC
jgi:hypothetical protein